MRIGLVVVVCAVLGLAGCSGAVIGSGDSGAGAAVAGARLTGVVHGGQQALVGAHVYLLAAASGASGSGNGAGMAAYGGAGIAASANNASVSLMTTGTLDQTVGAATYGDYYVTTDGSGNFTITGDYTCTAGQQVYLYVTGGDPGLQTGVNPAVGLMAALGNCPGTAGSTGNAFSSGLYVVVNEVSTVAAAYAMAGFATDATHVGSSGTALALTGIANAFANAGNLADLGSGAALATTFFANGGRVAPQSELNSLANILAACVNSNGAVTGPTNATACYTLFTNATADGTMTGAMPADTATAAVNIAHNPGANVAALYGLSTASPPFAGGLTVAPNDWTIALSFTGGGLNGPYGIAIDGSDNVWVVNDGGNSLTELTNAGTVVGNFTGDGFSEPIAVAIDGKGNAWVTDFFTNRVTEISATGVALSGPTGVGSPGVLESPHDVAIDASGNAWVSESISTNVVKVTNNSSNVYSFADYTATGMALVSGVAIDGSGNIWTANGFGSGSIIELNSSGSATPNSPFTGGGINDPYEIAIDSAGSVFTMNYTHGNLTKLTNAGVPVTGSPFSGGGLDLPEAMTLDGAGNVWLTNYYSRVSEFTNAGIAVTPSTGYTASGMTNSWGIAVDGSGDVWLSNSGGSSLTELVGAGAPVITPIAAGLPSTPTLDGSSNLGTRP